MFHMLTVMRCTRHCRPKRVLEIGGGYGAPGRIWMTNGLHRPERYIDVDFPESLFYAEVYLRATMPNCSLTYVHAGDRLPPSSETQFVLCPIPHMDVAFQAPNDLLINTGSMQEMTDDYVAFYMRVIEWSPCNMFYSCNYFGQPIDSARQESMNIGAPVMAKTWKTAYRRFGGGKEGGTAECFFVRVGEEDCIPAAEAALRKPPADAAGFLDVFDAVRRTGAIS
jgi:hypothetical protein